MATEFNPLALPSVPSKQEIEAGRTERGGFTREQLATWGVPWPPPNNWRRRLIAEHERRQVVATLSRTPVERPAYLSAEEMADRLRVNSKTVRRHAEELGGFRVGRVWRFPANAS